MDKTEYSEYLNHPLWIEKREKVFRYYGKKCSKCGLTKNLIVHHKTYSHGKMPWEYPIENFKVLCERCHEKEHNVVYMANRCERCGREISKKFRYCFNCQKNITVELDRRIADVEHQLRGARAEGKTPTPSEINRLEKERKNVMTEKLRLERNLEEMDRVRKEDTRRIGDQIKSLKKVILGAVVILGLIFMYFGLRGGIEEKKGLSSIQTEGKGFISLTELQKNIGKNITVEGIVAEVIYAKNGNIYINIGDRYPRNKLALVIFKKTASKFSNLKNLEKRLVRVEGKLSSYKNKPQIILNKTWQIELLP